MHSPSPIRKCTSSQPLLEPIPYMDLSDDSKYIRRTRSSSSFSVNLSAYPEDVSEAKHYKNSTKTSPYSILKYVGCVVLGMTLYAAVTVWTTPIVEPQPQTALPNLLQENSLSQARIAYINGHHGTSDDFKYLAKQLHFNFSEFNPRLLSDYGPKKDKVEHFLNDDLGDFFCSGFDIVVVGDTNPDGRFLLDRIDRSPDIGEAPSSSKKPCALKKLIMETTNRFDFGLNGDDAKDYFNTIARVAQRKDNKVMWVANNPWEPKYAELAMGGIKMNYTLIRPFGFSSLPHAKPIPENERHLPVMYRHGFIKNFDEKVKEAGIEIKEYEHFYGGPTTLAQYKAFITLPYQVSTMKMYENLAAGVVTLVPSPAYLKSIMHSQDYVLVNIWGTLDVGDEWYKYIETYSDDLGEYHYTFDSMDHLKELLAQPNLDTRNVRQRAPVFWKQMREKALADWKKVLEL